MEIINGVINNAWFVSLVAGIIVYFVTDGLNKMKSNKEYNRNLQLVTKDVLQMLQEFIVENKLPEPYLLNSYYIATCKKYGVETKDADSIEVILNVLIKEVFDSSFLPKEDKISYCQEIGKTKEYIIKNEIEIVTINEESSERELSMRRDRRILSTILSAVTTFIVLYLMLLKSKQEDLFSDFTVDKVSSVAPVIVISIIVIAALLIVSEWIKKRKIEKSRTRNELSFLL